MSVFEHREAKIISEFCDELQIRSAINSRRALDSRRISVDSDSASFLGPTWVLEEESLQNISKRAWEISNQNLEIYDRRMRLLYNSAMEIIDCYVPEWPSKDSAWRVFTNQFFEYLYREEDDLVLAVAKLQGSRVNYWNDGLCKFVDSLYIKELIDTMKSYNLEDQLVQVFQNIATTARHDSTDEVFREFPKFIDKLNNEGLLNRTKDIIDVWAGLTKSLDDFYPHVDNNIALLRTIEKISLNTELVFKFIKSYAHSKRPGRYSYRAYSSFESLVNVCVEIEQGHSAERATELLNIGVILNNSGLESYYFLENKDRNNERVYLQYAIDLSLISTEASNSFLASGKSILRFEAEKRARILSIGKNLAEFLPKAACGYFSNVLTIAILRPSDLNSWVESILKFGKLAPNYVKKYCDISTHLVHSNRFEEFRDAAIELSTKLEALHENKPELLEIEQEVEGCAGEKEPIYKLFFNFFERRGFSSSSRKEFIGSSLQYVSDLVRAYENLELSAFGPVLRRVEDGIFYNNFKSFSPVLNYLTWLNNTKHLMAIGINDDQPYHELVRKSVNEMRTFLLRENVHKSREERLAIISEMVNQKFDQESIENLSDSEFINLAFLCKENFDQKRTQAIFNCILFKDTLPKNFPLNRKYAELKLDKNLNGPEKLVIKSQTGTLSDCFDHLFRYPPYFEREIRKERNIQNQLLYEDHGHLYFYHEYAKGVRMPVGNISFVLVEDTDESLVLFVSDINVEQVVQSHTGKDDLCNVLEQVMCDFAKDCNAKSVLYRGTYIGNSHKEFVEYLRKYQGTTFDKYPISPIDRERVIDSFSKELKVELIEESERIPEPEEEVEHYLGGGSGTPKLRELSHRVASEYNLGIAGFEDPFNSKVNESGDGTKWVELYYMSDMEGYRIFI